MASLSSMSVAGFPEQSSAQARPTRTERTHPSTILRWVVFPAGADYLDNLRSAQDRRRSPILFSGSVEAHIAAEHILLAQRQGLVSTARSEVIAIGNARP
jgi:hypothetical protein